MILFYLNNIKFWIKNKYQKLQELEKDYQEIDSELFGLMLEFINQNN